MKSTFWVHEWICRSARRPIKALGHQIIIHKEDVGLYGNNLLHRDDLVVGKAPHSSHYKRLVAIDFSL